MRERRKINIPNTTKENWNTHTNIRKINVKTKAVRDKGGYFIVTKEQYNKNTKQVPV